MIALVLTLALAVGAAAPEPSGAGEAALARIVARSKSVPGAILVVRREGAPDQRYATGRRAFGGDPLQSEDEFRIASVTKTYVAAAVLRLVEDGRLDLADPVARHVDAALLKPLRDAGYDVDRITLADLLSHRAGLRDYATLDAYIGAVADDPGRTWTREEQVRITALAGKPLEPPGGAYNYSDAGYVILGAAVETATGEPLATAVPRLLGFEALGLRRTRWEPVPNGKLAQVPPDRAHAYFDDVDTAAFNPSFDTYGGGGLVASADEALSFFQALFEGRVFRRPETLAAMLAPASRPASADAAAGYGLGIERMPIGAVECWGHKGHWSTLALWCPALRGGYVLSLNAAGDDAYRRVRGASRLAERLLADEVR